MRFGARAGGLPASVFNMSRTDMAGIAMLVVVLACLVIAVGILRE